MADDIAGRVTWQGDVAGCVTGGQFPVSWCTAFVRKWFGKRGLRHSREGDTWQEYDGKTAHLPDANHQPVSEGKGPAHRRSGARIIRRLAGKVRRRRDKG